MPKPKIVAIDDEVEFIDVIRNYFELRGYDITVAIRGTKGIELVKKNKPDVVLMGPKIGEHDYQFKMRHLEDFLKSGDKVKVTMIFRGREMAHIDLGRKVLDRLSSDISGIGEVEEMPRLEGRFLNMIIRAK